MSARAKDATAVEAYARDGVVHLKGAFDGTWVDLAATGLARNLRRPGHFFRNHTPEGSAGRYLFDFWSWPDIPEFQSLIFNSPAGEIAGHLMCADEVRMVMDNWFLREAGATNGAPWHHDEPYFDFEGRLCVIWIPLEPVTREEGLTFIAGSHKWGKLFMAQQFSDNVPFKCEGDDYRPVPDIRTVPSDYELLSCNMDAGDCLAFDFRTLHGASTLDHPLDRTIRRVTFRFGTEDTVFRRRGPWTAEISDHLAALGQQDNALLDVPLTPVVWQAG